MPETSTKTDYVVGVDLGGTKILAGVFDAQHRCLARAKITTKAERGPDGVIDRVIRCIKEAVDECDLEFKRIKGIGIGAPGAVNPEEGLVIYAPNLGWEDVPLRKTVEKALNVATYIENDCNACTLGIHAVEFDSKPSHLVGLFLGTGIGAGIVLNGKLFSGFNHTAGEIGHMVLEVGGPKCSCGNRGCFEALASRSAIFRRVQEAVKEGQKTILTDMLGDRLEGLRSGDLRKAVERRDRLAERIVEEAAEYTGIAVANLINLLNPEVIVLGGGVLEQLEDEMMAIIVETAQDYAMAGTSRGIDIVATKLADDAGIVGGSVLARQHLR